MNSCFNFRGLPHSPEGRIGIDRGILHRAQSWLLAALLAALTAANATAQKNNSQSETENQVPSHKVQDYAKEDKDKSVVLVRKTSATVDVTSTVNTPDQPVTKPNVAPPPGPQQQRQHEEGVGPDDMPLGEEDANSFKPRVALPTILNPDSPRLDKTVRREDIPPVPDDYVIGEEDVLTITVWKEHDISSTMVVRPDGKITVPLLGEISVVGTKPADLQEKLSELLKPFVNVPQVSVAVNQINSRKIYLIGEVVKEGMYPINSSETVLQVLAGAGGLRDFAKRKKIYILRKQNGEEIRFPFDYDSAIRGRKTEQNIRLEPGDTIVVP